MLSELAGEKCSPDPDIAGLAADSRDVEPGFLFAAIPGARKDGAAFIPEAEERGAAAILAPTGVASSLPLIVDETPRLRLSQMAARFYPEQPDIIAGVTGTNGKTSVARFAAQLWAMLGKSSGSMGTLGAEAANFKRALAHTTPEPVTLHRTLNDMAGAGVTHLAMEVSSHGLAQHRVDHVRFSMAAFTNVTQDHLDYHQDFPGYLEAKLRLFSELLSHDGVAVVNDAGEFAGRFAAAAIRRGVITRTVGARGLDFNLKSVRPHGNGLALAIAENGALHRVNLPLIGSFQAENALVAAVMVIESGARAGDVFPLLEKLNAVAGRMELAAKVGAAPVYVDYAHTPAAVATAIRALRPHVSGRLIAIIGAGGDRDRDKRKRMGLAAHMNADEVIVTDDNPRMEDAAAIRRQLLEGAAKAVEIGDRRAAIAAGIARLEDEDALLIAGKGHETGQEIGGEILPFNDVEEAKSAAVKRLKELGR